VVEEYGRIIEPKLDAFSSRLCKEAKKYHPFIGAAYDLAAEFLSRKGKRIASCSTMLAYEGYGGKRDENILDVCVAIELYRHSILLHDDLIDRDEERRGGKAFHKLFTGKFEDRFGEGLAVFYGNILFSQALTTLLNAKFNKSRLEQAVRSLVENYCAVNESQALDLLFEYKEPSVDEWKTMASKRAASLFRATMTIGAVLGGAPNKDLQIIKEAAACIGYSFDIQDDIIDMFASEEQYGRPPGRDILLGKKPLHIVYAYQLLEKDELKKLRQLIGTKKLDKERLEYVRESIRKCGALDKAKQVSKEYAGRAVELIEKTSMNLKAKNFFKDLIQFVSESLDWYK